MISLGFLPIIVPQSLRYYTVTFTCWSIDCRLPLLNMFCNYTHILAFRKFLSYVVWEAFPFQHFLILYFQTLEQLGFFFVFRFFFLAVAAKFREPEFPLNVSLIKCDENYTFMWIYLYLLSILLLAKVKLR